MRKFYDLPAIPGKAEAAQVYFQRSNNHNSGYFVLLNHRRHIADSSPSTRKYYQKHLDNAKGDVLIFGLGIGFIPYSLMLDNEIKSITIVEKNPAIIELVSPFLPSSKVNILQGDVFSWKPLTNKTYDYIFSNIYQAKGSDFQRKITEIKQRYVSILNKNGVFDYFAFD